MKRILIAAGLALAACTTTAASDDPPASAPAEDACRASDYQHLIGKKISEVPPKPEGAIWRQACTQCPVTMDYNLNRMNIFFDQATEVIKEVRCG